MAKIFEDMNEASVESSGLITHGSREDAGTETDEIFVGNQVPTQ